MNVSEDITYAKSNIEDVRFARKLYHPVKPAPERLNIQEIRASGSDNGSPKPAKEKSVGSNRSSTSQTSNGVFPRIHTGFGTPLPWMDVHVRRMHEQVYGDPPGKIAKNEKEEDKVEIVPDNSDTWHDKRTLYTVVILLVTLMVLVIIAGIIVIIEVSDDDDDESDSPSVLTTLEPPRVQYFIASFDASMSLINQQYVSELADQDTPESIQLTRSTCAEVRVIFSTFPEYAGCEGVAFREEGSQLTFDLIVKMLYVIEYTLPPGATTLQEATIINDRLKEVRDEMSPLIRERFIVGVNDNQGLSNAQIESVPTTEIVYEDTNFCVPNPCNDGTCSPEYSMNINVGYICICPDTHTGRQCQVTL